MRMNPANLAVRFILEICAFIAMGMWGWRLSDNWPQYLLSTGVPLVAAIVWGTFNVPHDPSRSGKAPVPVPGLVRLLIELGIFSLAAWALYDIGYDTYSFILIASVITHYAISYKRIKWLLAR